MMSPKIELTKAVVDGKVDIMVYIRDASAELAQECERLGYTNVCVGQYKIHCGTATALDAARNPIRKFFA